MKSLRRLVCALLLGLAPHAVMAADRLLSMGEGDDPAYPAALGQALRAAVTAERGADIAAKAVVGPVAAKPAELAPPPGLGTTSTAAIRGSQAAGAFGAEDDDTPKDFLPDRPVVPFSAESGGTVQRYQILAASHGAAGWHILVLAEIASK